RCTTSPASTPATTPTRTHATNIAKLMTLPPSSGYDGPTSLPRHRLTPRAPSRASSHGRTRAQPCPDEGRSGHCAIAVLSHQDGGEHLDRPLVEGPVVDHHVHDGTREPPDPLGRRGGADDDVHSPHQPPQCGPRAAAGPDQ